MNKMSSLEQVVYNLLVQANFRFEQEKQFKDCYNGYYRYDFFLPDLNCCIELNGAQHYQYTKIFHKNKSEFTKAQERDRRKISYCLARDIKLYCIPYWEIDSIKTINDLFNDRFLAKTKFHNDIAWKQQKCK